MITSLRTDRNINWDNTHKKNPLNLPTATTSSPDTSTTLSQDGWIGSDCSSV